MNRAGNSSFQPLVTMVVPVFNAVAYLDQALGSLQGQTYENLEIICLNDGSTDDSLAILERHATGDERIRVIDKANEGYGATCNRGLAEAHGEWLGILEPDDWLLPDSVKRMVGFVRLAADAAMRATDRLPDMVKTPYWRVLFANTSEQTLVHCYYKGTPAPAGALHLPGGWLAEGNPAIAACTNLMEYHPSIWSALYRTSFLRKNAIRFLPIPGAGWADNPFLIETMTAAQSIAYLDEPFYCYREETPAHFETTVRKQPMLVFDRWHDGADALERCPDLDRRVVRAHYRRGFNNRDKAAAILGEDNALVQQETARMFARMDEALVLSDPALSSSQKTLFAQMTDVSYTASVGEKAKYAARKAAQRLQHVRTVGIAGSRAIARWR